MMDFGHFSSSSEKLSRSASPAEPIAVTTPTALDNTFRTEFADIVERWRRGRINRRDKDYLISLRFTPDEFVRITEEYSLTHGVELIHSRIIFLRVPNRSP